jgi:hypothetical protein
MLSSMLWITNIGQVKIKRNVLHLIKIKIVMLSLSLLFIDFISLFNSSQLMEIANGASEMARAYIRRARETIRTGMLIFRFSSTLRSEVVTFTVKHIVLELFLEKSKILYANFQYGA